MCCLFCSKFPLQNIVPIDHMQIQILLCNFCQGLCILLYQHDFANRRLRLLVVLVRKHMHLCLYCVDTSSLHHMLLCSVRVREFRRHDHMHMLCSLVVAGQVQMQKDYNFRRNNTGLQLDCLCLAILTVVCGFAMATNCIVLIFRRS